MKMPITEPNTEDYLAIARNISILSNANGSSGRVGDCADSCGGSCSTGVGRNACTSSVSGPVPLVTFWDEGSESIRR